MKIYAFIQMYNESITGHLVRCLENCKEWASNIILYDDKSTDNSVEIASNYTKHIILGEKNEWTKETSHKQKMLNYIHEMTEKPDWILWIDCDEIVCKNTIKNIYTLCNNNQNKDIDAFSFQQINLWRSETYYRKDGPLYGENPRGAGWFVRLWKYNNNLKMEEKIGPDQRLYPINIKTIEPCDFKIIHYGFSNYKNLMKHIGTHLSTKEQLIDTASGDIYVKLANNGVEWAKTYVNNGKGVPNMFINEENLVVEKCPIEWYPNKNIPTDIYFMPRPIKNKDLKTYNEIKENILFMGNCQVRVIKDYCMYYLNKKIDYLNIVYDLGKQSDRVDYLIKNADIIITQPFYEGRWYYSLKKIDEIRNKNSYIKIIHCLYYDGYFPYLNIENYNNIDKDNNLREKIIENSENSLKNFYERENGLNNYIKIDIPFYDFIKNNYMKTRLFLRENHPTNYVMNQYSYCIYKQIYIDNKYFHDNKLNKYNDKFDKEVERLNQPNTYLKIDSFTKEVLELEKE
jgi:hypothetical protein